MQRVIFLCFMLTAALTPSLHLTIPTVQNLYGHSLLHNAPVSGSGPKLWSTCGIHRRQLPPPGWQEIPPLFTLCPFIQHVQVSGTGCQGLLCYFELILSLVSCTSIYYYMASKLSIALSFQWLHLNYYDQDVLL